MSIVQTPRSEQVPLASLAGRSQKWRLPLLGIFLSLSLGLNVWLRIIVPSELTGPLLPHIPIWLLSFLPYLAACLVVLVTPVQTGRWRWIELGLIMLGALLLRAILVPTLPNLSEDSLRYLWDARVTLHGFSPYAVFPNDPRLLSLRDDFLYPRMGYVNAPTIYPPGAQFIYLLSYLLAPANIFVLKGFFVFFDLVTSLALAVLLMKRGLDPSRTIIYAWCPLPIAEFAIQGHVDAVMITFVVLAVLCALGQWRGARVAAGFLLGMATLIKLYPVVLLVVILRRRDYALLATFVGTIIAGYLPYLILGQGQVFGFFTIYASQHGQNAGSVDLVLIWLGFGVHISLPVIVAVERVIDVLLVLGVPLMIFVLRLRERISMEAAILILIGTFFSLSSHVFPWYDAVFLPWAAVLIGPLWRNSGRGLLRLNGKPVAAAAVWYFACASVIGYLFRTSGDWRLYYVLVYDVLFAGLVIAVIVGILRLRTKDTANQAKSEPYAGR